MTCPTGTPSWLRPEAWLVTTGGVSSAEEEAYARQLEAAAETAGWRLRLGLLAGNEPVDDGDGGRPRGPEDRDDWPPDGPDTPDDESERLVFAY